MCALCGVALTYYTTKKASSQLYPVHNNPTFVAEEIVFSLSPNSPYDL
jgi:hypothetical protein